MNIIDLNLYASTTKAEDNSNSKFLIKIFLTNLIGSFFIIPNDINKKRFHSNNTTESFFIFLIT